MNFYIDPAFYVFLAVAIVPAAILGFSGRRIKYYGCLLYTSTALRPLMTVEEYERALTGGGAASPSSWISLVPLVSADNEISSISMAFNRYFIQNGQDDLRFSCYMVKEGVRTFFRTA